MRQATPGVLKEAPRIPDLDGIGVDEQVESAEMRVVWGAR